jgi:hypothetical protein
VQLSGPDLILGGSGGTAFGNYSLLSTTNVETALGSWAVEGSFQFDAGGNFTITNTVRAARENSTSSNCLAGVSGAGSAFIPRRRCRFP